MGDKRRKRRARGTPRWLMKQTDLDAIAQRRVLMILNVLSGSMSVSTAIEEGKISRGLYYQLETRALNAMLLALEPGAESEGDPLAGTKERMGVLEDKIERLEKDKRRLERLHFLTSKVMKSGPLTTGAGRPPKSRSSTRSGKSASPRSTRKTSTASDRNEAAQKTTSPIGLVAQR